MNGQINNLNCNNPLYITGVGLVTENLQNLHPFLSKNIDEMDDLAPSKNIQDYWHKQYQFQSQHRIAREDRGSLHSIAKLCIDSALQAFAMSETQSTFSATDKETFAVFAAAEIAEEDLAAFDNWVRNRGSMDEIFHHLSKMKAYINPTDLLRELTTSTIYHVSKVLGLRGNGLHIRRMSLSGLCALEASIHSLKQETQKSLITSAGNMIFPFNICAFEKQGQIKTEQRKEGMIPSFGSASLIIEKAPHLNSDKRKFAEIMHVKSRYKVPTIPISKQDWLDHFIDFQSYIDRSKLTIIAYDSGINAFSRPEQEALRAVFPEVPQFSYKRYVGYTGTANNLIDLVIALCDQRIPIGSQILINGLGSGLGSILLKKQHNPLSVIQKVPSHET